MTSPRRPLPRTSLRTNAVLMVLAMLVLPQAIVVGWSAMERDIGGKLQWNARETAQDAADTLAAARAEGLDAQQTEEKLAEVATQHTARIRVIRQDGSERFDVDRDQGTDVVHQVGTLFFGPDGAPTLREFDETVGPVQKRHEILVITRWHVEGEATPSSPRAPLPEGTSHASSFPAFRGAPPPPVSPDVETGCRTSPAGKLLVCHAARAIAADDGVDAIYVQESSRRAVRA
ncbi:MAG: hypothetical protein JWO86_282, partial [Myxococcaceae bacterium]|nr:hypothetical protein [Myxococcaceae bacterium]